MAEDDEEDDINEGGMSKEMTAEISDIVQFKT